MNKQKIVLVVIAAVGILATFMPWVNVPIVGSINGTQGGGPGWITLGLFAVALVVSLLGDRSKALISPNLYGVVLPGAIAAIYAIYKIVKFRSAMGDMDGGDNPFAAALGSSVSVGVGLYLVALVGIALVIVPFVLKDETTSITGSSANL